MDLGPVTELWRRRNEPYLERCRGRRLLVAFSGGKDSAASLHLLEGARRHYGYEVEAHLYAFPRHLYGQSFRTTFPAYWAGRGIRLVIHEADPSDPDIRGIEDPCRLCQGVRKKALARIFPTLGVPLEQLVVVTGHSLWDLAGYAIEHLVNHELADPAPGAEEQARERFQEISQRFYPWYVRREGFAIYRPMHFLNQEEIRTVQREAALPIDDSSCEFAANRPKKSLAGYFRHFGLEFSYDRVMAFARQHLGLEPEPSLDTPLEEFLGRRF
jgi:tRNA(Ile)-lysidine synthase TilS/MesJ